MATILEFLLKYAVQSSNYGGYLKLLKVIQDCHQNYCFKLCILEETPNLWPWKYGDHNTQWILSISMDHNYSFSQFVNHIDTYVCIHIQNKNESKNLGQKEIPAVGFFHGNCKQHNDHGLSHGNCKNRNDLGFSMGIVGN